mgnify:CR=1 FL=1
MSWLGTWAKRIQLDIDNTKIDGALSNFPVTIHLSASSGITSADVSAVFDELTSDANRKKIAVTSSDGTTELYVEIEKWDDANEEAWLHVKVPSVASGADTVLYLYYDSAQADNTTYIGDTTDAVTHNVWDSDFEAVYHMAQDPNGDAADAIKDSTSNTYDGTPQGSMTSADLVSGKIADGIDFDGIDDGIKTSTMGSFGSNLLSTNCTVETVLKSSGSAVMRPLGTFNDGLNTAIAIYLNCDNDDNNNLGEIKYYLRDEDENILWAENSGNTGVTDGNFHHLAAVFEPASSNGVISPYIDGTSDPIDAYSRRDADNFANFQYPVAIGASNARGTLTNFVDGIICELRISSTARSAAWIKATYHSLWDSLITFGSEDTPVEEGSLTEATALDDTIEVDQTVFNPSLTEAVDVDDTLAPQTAYNSPGITEGVGVTAALVAGIYDVETTEAVDLNDTPAAQTTYNDPALSEATDLNDTPAAQVSYNLALTEAVALDDTPVGIATFSMSLPSEDVDVDDTTEVLWTAVEVVEEEPFFYDELSWTWKKSATSSMTITDTATIEVTWPIHDWIWANDTVTNNWTGGESVTSEILALDALVWIWPESVTSEITATDVALVETEWEVSDYIDCVDSTTTKWTGAETITDTLTILGQSIIFQVFNETATSEIEATDAASYLHQMLSAVTSSITVSETISPQFAYNPTIAEAVAISGVVTAIRTLNESLTESPTIADALAWAWREAVTSEIEATDAAVLAWVAIEALTSDIEFTETALGSLVFSDTITETITYAVTLGLQQILSQVVTEELEFGVTVELDGELWETWVLNTQAFHASVYSNYDFNSFSVYNNTAFGCKADGVYKLSGDTDDGTAILPGIVLPETWWGTNRRKRFRKAFFGLSGGTTPSIRLETDSGSQTYTISNSRSAITRNLYGRQWTLKLQDFSSLEFIELFPVILTR